MQLHIQVDERTSPEDLHALSVFARELSAYRSGGAIPTGPLTAPPDEAELSEPELVVVGDTVSAEPQVAEAPKRRRRTKAEIEADAAAAATLPEVPEEPVGAEPGTVPEVSPEPTPLVESPAPTQPAPQQDTPPSETASTAPASASPSDGTSYTAADVQKMAVDAARRFGPEKVKAIIAEYPGATKIADLIPGDLASFVGKLNALSVE
jgi:hypothetical protein